MQSIHKVNNKQQDKHIEAQVWGEASDKTPVYAADVIVTYQVLPEKSAWLYANKKSPSRAQLGEKEGGPKVIFPVSDLARLPKPDHHQSLVD